jgi:hypothetical protein
LAEAAKLGFTTAMTSDMEPAISVLVTKVGDDYVVDASAVVFLGPGMRIFGI